MAILRYKLAFPDSGIRGFMISNADSLEGEEIPENFSNPPIKMTLLRSDGRNLADCFVGAKDTWIEDMKEEVLNGEIPGWRLTEVEFRRRSPRLGFRCEGCGVESLYIADDAAVALQFEVHRSEDLSPCVYTVGHYWPLYGKDGRKTYLTGTVEESVSGKVRRRIEFDISHDPKSRTPEFYAKRPEKHIIITELC